MVGAGGGAAATSPAAPAAAGGGCNCGGAADAAASGAAAAVCDALPPPLPASSSSSASILDFGADRRSHSSTVRQATHDRQLSGSAGHVVGSSSSTMWYAKMPSTASVTPVVLSTLQARLASSMPDRMTTSRLAVVMIVYERCETRCSTRYEATDDAYCSSELRKRATMGKLREGGEGWRWRRRRRRRRRLLRTRPHHARQRRT